MGVLSLPLVASVILRKAFDPHCAKGVTNRELTACCVADCGSCEENSDVCQDAEKNGRGSTCCPSQVTQAPSCEASMAPCAIPDYVRNPPAQQYGDRHAKDDCNEAIPTQDAANHLSTAYIKFEGKAASSNAASTSCGTSYSTKAQISAACTDNDNCMGFSTDSNDDPKCLVIAGNAVETLGSSSDSVYLKREDGRAGATFRFKGTEWGDCNNGEKEAQLTACESTAGVTKNLGMCSLLVAMNPDGYKQPC